MTEPESPPLEVNFTTLVVCLFACELLSLGLVTFTLNLAMSFGWQPSFGQFAGHIPSTQNLLLTTIDLLLGIGVLPVLLANYWDIRVSQLVPLKLPSLGMSVRKLPQIGDR